MQIILSFYFNKIVTDLNFPFYVFKLKMMKIYPSRHYRWSNTICKEEVNVNTSVWLTVTEVSDQNTTNYS